MSEELKPCPFCKCEVEPRIMTAPYPEILGLVCFADGYYEIDTFSPDIAPNQLYRRADVVDAELKQLREENERLRQDADEPAPKLEDE